MVALGADARLIAVIIKQGRFCCSSLRLFVLEPSRILQVARSNYRKRSFVNGAHPSPFRIASLDDRKYRAVLDRRAVFALFCADRLKLRSAERIFAKKSRIV